MKDFIGNILLVYFTVIGLLFTVNIIGGYISSERQCNSSPSRLSKYTGIHQGYELGCWLGVKVD